MSDTYSTIEATVRAQYGVQDSRFLADAFPVRSRAAIRDRVAAVRDREPKAAHYCRAYRLGTSGEDVKCDDDGEPSGTAGPPILRQIDARGLTNVLVVVSRHFGGTELGTGGLMRAYSEAASRALDRVSIVERVVRTPVRIRFAYDDTSPARQVIEQFDVEVTDSEYTEVTTLTLAVRRSEVDAFIDAFTNALSDRGDILRRGKGDRPEP